MADTRRQRIELYDIAADRFETNNLAKQKSAKVIELLAMWDAWKSELPE